MRLYSLVTSALLVVVLAAPSGAGEQLVERFEDRGRFASLWAEGSLEFGGAPQLSWARIKTSGSGEASFVANVSPYQPALDFEDKFVKVWLRVSDVARLGGLELRLSSDRFAGSYFAFSLDQYADVHFNYLGDDDWTPVTWSFGSARIEGTPDRRAITDVGWFVFDKGEGQPVQMDWAGLAMVDLPGEGVLSFTFDDGYDDHLLAAKLMAAQGYRGTAYIIPEALGREGYLSLEQVHELADRYGWEIAAHHATPFTELEPAALELEILALRRFLIDNDFAAGADHLAYPLGRQDVDVVRPLARKYFATARIAARGPETVPPGDPHLLRVFNVTPETTPAQVGAAARRAREHGEWLILMLHYLVEEPRKEIDYGIADFEKLVAAVHESGIRVAPVAEVWEACGTEHRGGCRVAPMPAAREPSGPSE